MTDRAITLEVDNAAAIRELLRFNRAVTDFRVANKKVAIDLYGWTMRNYENEGALVGGWAPLAPATVKRKLKQGYTARTLLRTGALRQNFAFFSDETQAGVGNRTSYSLPHEMGAPSRNLPRRRTMPEEIEMREIAERTYGAHVRNAAEGGTP
jgi:phage gpG-like protein